VRGFLEFMLFLSLAILGGVAGVLFGAGIGLALAKAASVITDDPSPLWLILTLAAGVVGGVVGFFYAWLAMVRWTAARQKERVEGLRGFPVVQLAKNENRPTGDVGQECPTHRMKTSCAQ
jgi:hypothetical protein